MRRIVCVHDGIFTRIPLTKPRRRILVKRTIDDMRHIVPNTKGRREHCSRPHKNARMKPCGRLLHIFVDPKDV